MYNLGYEFIYNNGIKYSHTSRVDNPISPG